MPEKKNNVKRIGVISDTHIPARAASLPVSLAEKLAAVDFIIHCGDLVSSTVLKKLASIAPVYAVKGNMDPHEINEPDELIFEINSRFILCAAHGSGPPFNVKAGLLKKFSKYDPDVILFGHTHMQENTNYGNIVFFNPGSCTVGVDNNTIGILTVNSGNISGEIVLV
jgi:putative phosphoesterase